MKVKYLGETPVRLFGVDMYNGESYEINATKEQVEPFVKSKELSVIGKTE